MLRLALHFGQEVARRHGSVRGILNRPYRQRAAGGSAARHEIRGGLAIASLSMCLPIIGGLLDGGLGGKPFWAVAATA
jgi:hypothetical protein